MWKKLELNSAPSSRSSQQTILNNAVTMIPWSMPFKPSTMPQGSMFSSARNIYRQDAGGGANWYNGSDVTYIKKITAIGKEGAYVSNGLSYAAPDRNTLNSRLKKCRSGGSVAPKKKGFYR